MGHNLDLPAAAPAFLQRTGWDAAKMTEFSADAAFRRYFRLARPVGAGGKETAILMHAPNPSERSEWFVEMAEEIRARGMSGPAIYAKDMRHGLILLEDLGTAQYFLHLQSCAVEQEHELYAAATDVLVALHAKPMPARLGSVEIDQYSDARMVKEAELLLDWHWPELAGTEAPPELRESYAAAWQAVLPAGHYADDRMVQLDYHSPNLMWLPQRDGARRVGILDFQDAMRGPAAYDLVSLLQDARRDVADGVEAAMIARYLAAADLDEEAFRASYAVMGAQRAARILGVFVRLWRRDAKPGYLQHVPRLWAHLDTNLMHPALQPLRAWFDDNLPRSMRREFDPVR
ncbi:aminoglycoside phosphotransferase family protein [Pacificimonas sp. ICDLI1SI03]